MQSKTLSNSYMSCLVCDTFNCVIPRIDSGGNHIKTECSLHEGDLVRFKVKSIEVDKQGLIMVKGDPYDFTTIV